MTHILHRETRMGKRPIRPASDQLTLSGGPSIRGWFAHRQVPPTHKGPQTGLCFLLGYVLRCSARLVPGRPVCNRTSRPVTRRSRVHILPCYFEGPGRRGSPPAGQGSCSTLWSLAGGGEHTSVATFVANSSICDRLQIVRWPICRPFFNGPGRDRTCDLGIKSPARQHAAGCSELKDAANRADDRCSKQQRAAPNGDKRLRALYARQLALWTTSNELGLGGAGAR
jgi:hypothetical protein